MSESRPLLGSRTVDSANSSDNQWTSSETISALRGCVLATVIAVLLFLSTANVSVITTIQSSIAHDLDVTTGVSWFVSAFAIASASLTPLAGKLCQVFTIKSYLFWSLVLEAIGHLVSARATNAAAFIAGRVLYGGGAAAFGPVAIILVRQYAPERHHGVLFGTVNCAYTAGITCGAIIGGTLEPALGWRAVFWTQCVLVVLLAGIAYTAIPGLPNTGMQTTSDLSISQKLLRLDYLGIVSLVTSIVMLLYSLAAPQVTILPIIAAIILLAVFLITEVRLTRDPIIPPVILRSRSVMLTGLATLGSMSVRWAVLLYMPTYAIAVRLWSPARAGTLLIPTNLGFGVGGVVAGYVHVRKTQSYYISTLASFVLFAATEAGLSFLMAPHSPVWALVLVLFLNGFLTGAWLIYTLTHVLFLTEPEHSVVVIAIASMFRALSGAFGSSISGGIFVRSLQTALQRGFDAVGDSGQSDLIEQLLGRPQLVHSLRGVPQRVAIEGYATALVYLFVAGTGISLAMTVIQAGTGWTAPSGHRSKDVASAIVESQD